jgi:KUP system potassium uptake protein
MRGMAEIDPASLEPPEADDAPPPEPEPARGQQRAGGLAGMVALTVGALGVVFGDIGTSPLYALHTVFTFDNNAVRPTPDAIYGVISLVFWAITLIVSVKMVVLIMQADNDGEGGIMALIALVLTVVLRRPWAKAALVALGLFGASLFYGDGMITPAISVLSAVEGLKIVDPALDELVIPITVAVLTVLFAIQRFGTGTVGSLFGPVMVVWFAILAITGIHATAEHPGILRAASPTYGIDFLVEHGGVAFVALGGVVLTVTGAEALYADMGHFGRWPIRWAWFAVVFPALILNYMGQGALLLDDPTAIDNPFFLLMPHWSRIPMVILATVATVIASQAVISGAFSVTRQAVQLGFLPRVRVLHTSGQIEGQVYVPIVNWAIFAAVVGLVIGFGSSAHLGSAYGIAVTGTLAIDTVLFFVVVRHLWHKPLWLVLAGLVFFLTIDLTFFAANLTKVLHGGWFPLVVALAVFVVLTTWYRGRAILTRRRTELEGPLRKFVEEVRALDPPVYRAPRTGVYLNENIETTPLALRANVENNHTLHRNVVIISVRTLKVPHVPERERVKIDDLGYRDDGINHVTAHYGFQDDVDVPAILRLAADGLEGDVDRATAAYFLSRMTIVPTRAPGMARWRKMLFVIIARNAANPVLYFGLPDDRTLVVGSSVEL